MGWYSAVLDKFRRAPTPALVSIVASRLVFGFGLGAYLAAERKSPWKRVGACSMLAAVAMAVPAAIVILSGKK